MQKSLNISCKLQPTREQALKLEATFQAFSDACNYINETIDSKITNNVRIQTLIYQDIRQQFNLSANLAIRAINRVAADRKTAKRDNRTVKEFQPTSVDYDARIFSFREKDRTISLTLVGGRERFSIHLSNYQIGKLKGQKPTSATLVKRRDGSLFIDIHLKSELSTS
ncbi:hypothetical protein [Lyngbya aestuarii]|uniref:hypothetical protein n=1 Tax=Lyngbya aestuarii TaxID=118322 RepID=UPI00403DAE02